MSLLKKLAGQTAIYGVSHILSRILHFVLFSVYLSHKFPETKDFGIYTDLYAWASLILVLLVYRMDTAFFRFGSDPETKEKAFTTASLPLFFTVLLTCILMWYFYAEIAHLMSYNHKAIYVKWFVLILGFDALMALPFAKLRLDNKAKLFVIYKVANIVLTILLVLFFLEVLPNLTSTKEQIEAFFSIQKQLDYIFIANIIASGLLLLILLPIYKTINYQFDFKLWKKMFCYALPLVIVGLASSFNQAFAVPLQKAFLGNNFDENMTQAGIFALPAKIAILLNLFAVAFNYAAEPFFFNNSKNEDARVIYGKVALAFAIVGSFVLLLTALNIPLISSIIAPEYRSGMHIVPILLFAYLFLGLYYNFSIWYKLADKTYYGAIISIIAASTTLFISIVFLPKIGYIASAWAALACYIVMCILGLVTGKKYYPIDYPLAKILFYIILAFLILMFSYAIEDFINNSYLFWLVNMFLVLSYAVIVFKKEKELIQAFKN